MNRYIVEHILGIAIECEPQHIQFANSLMFEAITPTDGVSQAFEVSDTISAYVAPSFTQIQLALKDLGVEYHTIDAESRVDSYGHYVIVRVWQ